MPAAAVLVGTGPSSTDSVSNRCMVGQATAGLQTLNCKQQKNTGTGQAAQWLGRGCRKKKAVHKTTSTDDKRLQNTLKKLGVNTIPGIDEVMIFKDQEVIHFTSPKGVPPKPVRAQLLTCSSATALASIAQACACCTARLRQHQYVDSAFVHKYALPMAACLHLQCVPCWPSLVSCI